MNYNFQDFYAEQDAKTRHVYHVLSLSPCPIRVSALLSAVCIKKDISDKHLREILDRGIDEHFIYGFPNNTFLIQGYVLVWLYPLVTDCHSERRQIAALHQNNYYGYDNKILIEYLDALWRQPEQLKSREESILRLSNFDAIKAILIQPRYEEVYSRISPEIMEYIYSIKARDTTIQFDSLEALYRMDAQFDENQSPGLRTEQARIAYITGSLQKARQKARGLNAPIACYAEATSYFIDGDYSQALDMFENGLKKQRREYKKSYLPVIPEAALFYLVALLSGEQDDFLPVLQQITGLKTKPHTYVDEIFVKLCRHVMSNDAGSHSSFFKILKSYDYPVVTLWKVIALGFVDEKPSDQEREKWMETALQTLKQAFENGYLTVAYEAAYVLKNLESEEAAVIYGRLSEIMNYKPALSQIKRMNGWEKQINAYLSLDAVKTNIKHVNGAGKTRIAYRYYPERNYAAPIQQTRNARGDWTSGRSVAISSFTGKKIDGMSEQDKRIADATRSYSYYIDREALIQMAGHPHVFLSNSGIPVELVAAKPVISVVESKGGGYKLECDITDLRDDVHIEKETNTRYKVYDLDKYQREIIGAVKKGSEIPEAGKEKLLKVLEHFSAYMTVQTDFAASGIHARVREVAADSRIRVQLLPLGEGLRAEMFVKPFGVHPPYCKPGKGGKVLMTNQDGARLQATRDMESEIMYADRILADIQTIEGFDINEGMMTFDNPLDALELLDILRRHDDIAVVEWPEGERMRVRYSAGFENLNMRVTNGIDWFELEGELKIDEETVLSIGRLLELVRHGHGRFIELANGEFIALSERFKRRLAELSAFSSITKKTAAINRFAAASITDSFDEFENLKADKTWLDFRKRLQKAHEVDIALPAALQAELRPYQEDGYRWMTRLATWGAGACLADDMGLGKTVQAITSLLQRASMGPALVVSPLSVLPNWISEVNRFGPSLTIKTLGIGNRAETLASLGAGDLLVVSYGLLQSEEDAITTVEWATVILDEAHAIKNYTTKTSKAAMSLKAGFRIILTGTPLQNHLGELWNLFQFINPGLLGSLPNFTDQFIRPADNNARKRLKKLISPFILRRTKAAVLDELPPKTEIIRKIELSVEEMAFYEALRRRAIETIQNDDSPQGARHLKALAEITRLRLACCNPKLVEPGIEVGSTKLSVFMEIAAELKDNGHRALVFSQFVTHLTIVREALDKQGVGYQYLDGSTPPAKREAAVKNFQAGKGDLFLISLKAGGLGLNLTAADFVIHLDPWWNPSVEDQASDRAHRIGQSRPVTVYRLVAEHTIEEKIIQLHNTKRDLADSLLEGSDQSAKLSIEELIALMNPDIF